VIYDLHCCRSKHRQIIRHKASIKSITSGVAGILRPGTNTFFAPLPTKNAEFEMKNRRKGVEEVKEEYLLFVTFVIFRNSSL